MYYNAYMCCTSAPKILHLAICQHFLRRNSIRQQQILLVNKHKISIHNFFAYKIQAFSIGRSPVCTFTISKIGHIQCTGWYILTKHTEIRTHRRQTWEKHTVRLDRGCIGSGCCFPSRPSLNQRQSIYVVQSYDVSLPICR